MDEIPYKMIKKMNAVIPEYKSSSTSGKSGGEAKKSMTLFEIADAVGRGESI